MALFLGIDSSNYTSSVALVNEKKEIICDSRKLLLVKAGEKGLRQSDALYQHWNNLPVLLDPVLKQYAKDIKGICVSVKPRPIEGSYMPVFQAGTALAKVISASLNVPLLESTHQEGHIFAALKDSFIDKKKPFLCAHLSGGTLELVLVENKKISIQMATKDLSYGQILDRTGVLLGFPFPCGKYIDKEALSFIKNDKKNPFSKIKIDNKGLNLSGIETQVKNSIAIFSKEEICYFLMERIAESFVSLAKTALKNANVSQLLITGGVASSSFLRFYCQKENWSFGNAALCSDNAVGLALLQAEEVYEKC